MFQPKASSVDLNSRKSKVMIVTIACGLKKYKIQIYTIKKNIYMYLLKRLFKLK